MSWKRFFRREKWNEERARELEAHLQIEADENASRGVPADEARFAAQRKLGNTTLIREDIYHMNSLGFLDILWQDLKFGLRMLRKKPGFTAAAVLTLALGMGATTAIFSVVNSVLLRPLPYSDARSVIVIHETNPAVGVISDSYPNFLDWRQQTKTFSQMAAANTRSFNLSGTDQPENIGGLGVSPNFLSLLGVNPILGRDILPDEEKKGTAPVALISYKMWQSHFAGDQNVLGKPIQLDGRSFTIVGVLPPSFFFLDQADVITPIGVWIDGDLMDRGSRGDLEVIARLAPGATFSRARAEMRGITANLSRQYPDANLNFGIALSTIRDAFVSDTRPAILVLFGAVLFVLLIACANVANLYLVRGAERAKEVALRLALGASRARVIRQMLTESLLLAIFGGGLGMLLGIMSLAGLRRLIPADSLMGMDIRMDPGVFFFAAALIIFAAIAFGLVPALAATRPDVQEALKEGGRGGSTSRKQNRLRGSLAVVETALALVLLVGAGLMLKSLYRLFQVSPGFLPDRMLSMSINLSSSRYAKDEAVISFWQQTLDRVRALPGVESAAIGNHLPFTDEHGRSDMHFADLPLPQPGHFPHPDRHSISPGYLKAMGQPLLSGRDFTENDNEKAPLVALINQKMAQTFFPNGNAVGRRFKFGRGEAGNFITIVGVVADTKMYGLANPPRYEIYMPFRQDDSSSAHLVMRSSVNPTSLASAARLVIAAVDKDQAVTGVATMQRLVNDSVSTQHVTLVLLEIFGALALLLAAIGIYGVTAYTVALRTQEFGIRMALGAQRQDILQMVLALGAKLALLGVAIGLLAALALSRLLSGLLYSVSASDPFTFACVAGVLVIVTLIACYIPAMRAMKVDPMIALRHE